ncbi:MAG TPA: chromosome segregation protein SMC [Chthoniobacterales bacterium]|jgi:chromosome segregation protein
MHLQSLELFGFKSFADKTVLNFHEGVTAIVGPNGCGKSNILDAVRWVLGEQSAKALRGGEMADVIFNGTDNRKAVGYAEVSLTFSDCGSDLGVDWHEVRVSRRVYRDGLSEYLLNKTVVRLKDVQSLFADTGVGRSAYSIMEQGRIDQILSSHPEDRRAVFEEAAGITKYKTQKREALRKLEATEANLLRLGDIIKEVKRQIGSLQRQAGKARRYQALMADLQVLDTHHSRDQLDSLGADLEASRLTTSQLDEKQRATENEIESRENELTEQRAQLDQVDARINEARGDVQRLQNQIATHRNRIEFNRERAQEIGALIERYESDISAAEKKLTQQEDEIHQTDALLAETEQLLKSKQSELEETATRSGDLRKAREEQEQQLQTLELNISKTQNRLADLEDDLAGTTERRAATAPQMEKLAASLGEAAAECERISARLGETRSRSTEEQIGLQDLAAKISMAEETVAQATQSLREIETSLQENARAVAERQSRLEILQQLNDEGEGLAHGSQALLKGLDEPERILPALRGALVSLIEVEEEFIPAIEAALGRNLHAIVLQDAALAGEIVAKLRDRSLGQTALVAPELVRSELPNELPLPEGSLGWAVDKVRAPAELQTVVRQLLGNVALARDLAQARQMKNDAPALAVATLSGEFVSRHGVIFGGRVSEENHSLFQRKAQIVSLGAEQRDLRAAGETLRERGQKAAQTLARAEEHHDESRGEAQAARNAHSATTLEVSNLERELHEASRKAETIEWEKSTLDQQLSVADERISQLENETNELRAALFEDEKRRDAATAAVKAARLRDAALAEQLSELRLAVATERQRHEGLRNQRQPMTARQAELTELLTSRRGDISTYQSRLEQQKSESAAAEKSIAQTSIELAAAESAVTEIVATRASRLTNVNAIEHDLRARRKSLSELHDARGKEEVRQTQLQLKIENLSEHVMRRYQIELRDFSPDRYAFTKVYRAQIKQRGKPEAETAEAENFDSAQLREIIEQLTRQLDAMGPVNLDAVQEYDELEERHTFLETQNTDLTNSRRELLDVIARINQTTEKLFAETFAQVKINFREMFAELFGGGRADLTLLDEADALNCGIDIIAKPPGKQLQNVSLLSGGERAMAGVALLFAIYMVRPSPFCILDEMDAPLDESNINRFIKVLDRFVRQTQFVIITHNKRTIAKADILYGVTMEERGVSKLVGMRLTNAQPEAAAPPDRPPVAAQQQPLDLDEPAAQSAAIVR